MGRVTYLLGCHFSSPEQQVYFLFPVFLYGRQSLHHIYGLGKLTCLLIEFLQIFKGLYIVEL